MKKTVYIMLLITVFVFFFSCSDANDPPDSTFELAEEHFFDTEGAYHFQSADWQTYKNAEELIDASDMVFLGKIVGIDFQALDTSTALPVSESTPDHARSLYTVYSVEVISVYKGTPETVQKVRVMGGMVGYEIDRQMAVMEEGKVFAREYGIPIQDRYQKIQCNIGESFLFSLKQFASGYPTIINLEQAIFDLEDPTQKKSIGNSSKVYYSGKKDEDGNPLISVKDIISEFGRSEWKAFDEKWKNGEFANK